MRLRSIHPKHLDSKGLVALRRESLLAKKVLEGNTKGYKNHPQLIRFKKTKDPISSINTYLYYVYQESLNRGFSFDKSKFNHININETITVTTGQIKFETQHILKKTQVRNYQKYEEIKNSKTIQANPIFKVIKGEIENREVI